MSQLGIVSGKPAQKQPQTNYTISALNSYNWATSDFVLAITVIDSPKIDVQPKSIQTSLGESVEFFLVATGTGLSYQWYCNSTAIAGATLSAFQIASVQSTDIASFYCIVKDTLKTEWPISSKVTGESHAK